MTTTDATPRTEVEFLADGWRARGLTISAFGLAAFLLLDYGLIAHDWMQSGEAPAGRRWLQPVFMTALWVVVTIAWLRRRRPVFAIREGRLHHSPVNPLARAFSVDLADVERIQSRTADVYVVLRSGKRRRARTVHLSRESREALAEVLRERVGVPVGGAQPG